MAIERLGVIRRATIVPQNSDRTNRRA
jgi:hypothetical protein